MWATQEHQLAPPRYTNSPCQTIPRSVVSTRVTSVHTCHQRKTTIISQNSSDCIANKYPQGDFFKTIVSTVRLNSLCTLSSFKTLKGEHMRSLIFSHTDQQFSTTGAEWHFTAFRSVSEATHVLPKFTIGFRIKTH